MINKKSDRVAQADRLGYRGTDFEKRLAKVAETTPRMIRFHAMRMLTEIALARPLSDAEQQKIYYKVSQSLTQKGPVKINLSDPWWAKLFKDLPINPVGSVIIPGGGDE